MAEHKSLAQDLFEDMGRKVAEASAQEGDDDTKVVDVIESLCMNCHEDVCMLLCAKDKQLTMTGNYKTPTHQDPFLPRNRHYVLRMSALPLQEYRGSACW
jgi:hypothetical protein